MAGPTKILATLMGTTSAGFFLLFLIGHNHPGYEGAAWFLAFLAVLLGVLSAVLFALAANPSRDAGEP